MSIKYEVPEVKQQPLKQHTIIYSWTILAGARNTLIAGPIPFRYRIRRMETVFGANTANLFVQYLIVSRNGNPYTNEPPPDTNVFASWSPSRWLSGENVIRRIPVEYSPEAEEKYVKLHVFNGSVITQVVCAWVQIEELS